MADNVIDTKAEKKRLKEEKKKLKQEQKNQRKEARQRAKELALEEANLSDDEESGGFSVFLVTAIIILVWLGIIGLLIKLDVGGFGSQVLAPVLSDVPVLNKILPESEETESTTGEDYGGYSNLKDAVNDVGMGHLVVSLVDGRVAQAEIRRQVAVAAEVPSVSINFLPHLVPVNRGIHSSILVTPKSGVTAETALKAIAAFYAGRRFVRVLPPGKLADTKHVTFTNICEIGCVDDAHTGRLVLSSALDNLTKGAAGQAVQNMNLVCGLPETLGLDTAR